MKSRLAGALLVATVADPTLQPGDQLAEFAKLETVLLQSEKELLGNPEVHAIFKRDAIHRIVRLYETGDAAGPSKESLEKVNRWRTKLAAFDKAQDEKKAVGSMAKPAVE